MLKKIVIPVSKGMRWNNHSYYKGKGLFKILRRTAHNRGGKRQYTVFGFDSASRFVSERVDWLTYRTVRVRPIRVTSCIKCGFRYRRVKGESVECPICAEVN